MKHLISYIEILSICISTAVSFGASAKVKESALSPERYQDVVRQASDMSFTKIGMKGDSIMLAEPEGRMEECSLWYMVALTRPRDKFTKKEWMDLSKVYANYGSYWLQHLHNSVTAYPLLRKSLEVKYEHCDKDLDIYLAHILLAQIYSNYDNHHKALQQLRTGLEETCASKGKEGYGYLLNYLISQAWQAGQLDSIKNDIRSYKNAMPNDAAMAEYNRHIAAAAERYIEGKYADAITHANSALEHLESEYGSKDLQKVIYLMMADASLKGRTHHKAREYLDSAANVADGVSIYDSFFLKKWQFSLEQEYFTSIGDVPSAKEVRYQSLLFRDSLYNLYNYSMLRDLEYQDEASTLLGDLDIYEERTRVLEIKNKENRVIIAIMAFGGSVIIILLLWLLYQSKKKKEYREALFTINKQLMTEKKEREVKDDESPSETQRTFDAVCAFMETRSEIYEPDFTIEEMSRLSGLKMRDISQAINSITGKNFSSLLADYRIREAGRILMDVDMTPRPTIEVLAETVGYKSRTHFSRVFKDVTGMTTSEFIRQAKNKTQDESPDPMSESSQ